MAATGLGCPLLPAAEPLVVANAGLSPAAGRRSCFHSGLAARSSWSRHGGLRHSVASILSHWQQHVCCRKTFLRSAGHYWHTVSSGARVTCSAQQDKENRGWWVGRRLLPRPEIKKGDTPWTSLTRGESDPNERPQWVPQWVPDSPPEWLESSLKQLERASRVAAGLTLAFGTAAVLRVLVFNPSCVPSGSMVPTLLPGDCVFVEISTYRFLRGPARGDIVVFRPPSSFISATMREEGDLDEGSPLDSAMSDAPGAQYVKRVVAVGGDTVQVEGGVVLVNGRPRSEEARGISSANYSFPELRVPNGTLFVLGDNRNRSADSHVWGFLSEDRVVGRSWLRWKPLSRIGILK